MPLRAWLVEVRTLQNILAKEVVSSGFVVVPNLPRNAFLASLSCSWQWDLLHVLISALYTCTQTHMHAPCMCIFICMCIYIYIYIYLSLSLCVFYVFKFITQGYMWPPVVLHLHTKGCNRSKTHDHVLGGRGSIYQALLPKPCKP